jgi:hypothetical protein
MSVAVVGRRQAWARTAAAWATIVVVTFRIVIGAADTLLDQRLRAVGHLNTAAVPGLAVVEPPVHCLDDEG